MEPTPREYDSVVLEWGKGDATYCSYKQLSNEHWSKQLFLMGSSEEVLKKHYKSLT